MTEHRGSEALPVGPTELLPKENDSKSYDRNQVEEEEEEEKAEEIEERVGESPPATESQLGNSNEPNSETLIDFPSSILQNQSFGMTQFQRLLVTLFVCIFSIELNIYYYFFNKKIMNCLVHVTDLKVSPNMLNSDDKVENKVRENLS